MNTHTTIEGAPAHRVNPGHRNDALCDASVTALLRLADAKNPMFTGLGTGVTGVTGFSTPAYRLKTQ